MNNETIGAISNRQIAERAGWRDIETKTGWFEYPWAGAYEKEWLEGTRPDDGCLNAIIPDYLHDTDAALTLPLEPDMYYLLEVPGEDSGARCAIWNQHPRSTNRGRLREVEVAADTPAAAICAAWWAWMEERE